MADTLGEAIRILQGLGQFELTDMSIENNKATKHFVNHRFRETIVIPYVGISDNLDFLMSKGEKLVTTADGIRCKVESYEEKHICELEEDIQSLYGIDAWSFVKRWYKADKDMQSMYFIKIKLVKEESNNE